jgi:hypothetical protein
MNDMRLIATAMEGSSIAVGHYPATPGDLEAAVVSLAPQLEPTYATKLPLVDGWGGSYRVRSDGVTYRITSHGADRRPDSEHPPHVRANGGTTSYAADLIFDAGSFVQFPDINHAGGFYAN